MSEREDVRLTRGRNEQEHSAGLLPLWSAFEALAKLSRGQGTFGEG